MKIILVLVNVLLIIFSVGLLLFSLIPILFCDTGSSACGTSAMVLAGGPVLAILLLGYSFSNLKEINKASIATAVAFVVATLPLLYFQFSSFISRF